MTDEDLKSRLLDAARPDPTPTEDLVAALAEMQDPKKTGATVGQRTYSYLTLPDLLKMARTTLGRHRIALMQHGIALPSGGVSVTTTLLHASGHTWITDPLELPSQRDPQSVGSVFTYARRYQLAALLGLSGSDDDDAQDTQPKKPEPTRTMRVASKRAGAGDTAPATRPPAPVQPHRKSDRDNAMAHMHALLTTLEKQQGQRMDPDTRRTMIRNLLHLDTLESAKDLTTEQLDEAIDILTALTREEPTEQLEAE